MLYCNHTIDEVSVGQVVEGHTGFSVVKQCVHGNKYYAWLGVDMMDADIDDNTDVVCVTDDNRHTINCCA